MDQSAAWSELSSLERPIMYSSALGASGIELTCVPHGSSGHGTKQIPHHVS